MKMRLTMRIGVLLVGALVTATLQLPAADFPTTARDKADKVVVLKSERKLVLMNKDQVLKTYRISLGGNPVGAKTWCGDNKTPEGEYVLDRRNAKSQFYRSIHISYPNADDLARAKKLGVAPGGDVFIHRRAVPDGTPIIIKP